MAHAKNVKRIIPEINKNIYFPSVFCILLLILCIFTIQANANDVVEIGEVNTPHGAVILIADGLSSCYIYPEYTPYAIDGTILEKADVPGILEISNNNCRILDVKVPQTFTEGGHSVLATGYSKSDAALTGSSGTTFYDVAHNYDYMTFAIMEKGDSYGFCSKQNVVIHDVDNSINEPEMVIETNFLSETTKKISFDIVDVMQSQSGGLQEQLDQYPEGSIERYNEYNIWAIKTGIDIIEYMKMEHPEQNYILTINVGAVDCAGHYKKNSGYIECIEGIDNASYTLYETCQEHNLAFIFTGDHGMAFPENDSKGGHQSDKYSKMTESQKVPLIIAANDVDNGIIDEKIGQEDIAPTILELLNIPGKLRLADGRAISLKDYVNLEVNVQNEGEITLSRNNSILFRGKITENTAFLGLEPDVEYDLEFVLTSDNSITYENSFIMNSDYILDIPTSEQGSKSDKSYQNSRYIVGGVLIGTVNLTGLLLIRRVLKEE
ncbi:sulfatase-like hydrolase/transferase [Methanolobus bombayensis]|uniref:sulfatase-like hydrolase/transferase n=1 Tax=Methanolobus bombayensis TaxID=38023 RepID=UPI001AE1D1FC|nr:sulfatase-like hydrolase/transferase [Methanolobus bombayensis]MBP1908525.1 bisphosphoglycerate-independent phosphoglycerate mutase (AlkP superfamily) [Methanolobus bombayensis]